MKRCTYRGCRRRPIKRLQQSIGGAAWLGCDEHWRAMDAALAVGLPGAMSGGAWVEVTDL